MNATWVLIPVFEDRKSLARLLGELPFATSGGAAVRLLIVDDGSSTPLELDSLPLPPVEVHLLTLRQNVGHQRAIACGLCHIAATDPAGAVVVMDGDGEDRPQDVARLIEALGAHPDFDAVVAVRGRRNESLTFRSLYALYRLIFWALTGRRLHFGNFAALRASAVERLVRTPSLWQHFPATLLKSGLPLGAVRVDRGHRYHGESRMELSSLVLHAIRSLSVFWESMLARILVVCAPLAVTCLALIGLALALKMAGDASPGWMTTAVGVLTLLLAQVVTIGLISLVAAHTLQGSAQAQPREHATAVVGAHTTSPPSKGASTIPTPSEASAVAVLPYALEERPLPEHPSRLPLIASILSAALIPLFLFLALSLHFRAPYGDMLPVEGVLVGISSGNPVLSSLIAFHDNEHWPVVPMALYAVDHWLLDARGTMLVATMLLACLACAALIVRTSACSLLVERLGWAGLSATLLLWPAHAWNLLWPKQAHVYLSVITALLAFWLASRERPGGGRGMDLRAIGVAALLVASAFSFSYGLVACLAAAAIYALGPRSRRAKLLVAGSGLAAVGVLVARWQPLTYHANPVPNLVRPLAFADFVAVFLGAPAYYLCEPFLGADLALGIARCAGAAVLLYGTLLLASAVDRLLRSQSILPTELFRAQVVAWGFGIAVITGTGRLGSGTHQALVSRYLVVSVLLYLVLLISGRSPGRWSWRVGLLLVLATALTTPTYAHRARRLSWEVDMGSVAAVLDLSTSAVPYRLYPDPNEDAGRALVHLVMDDYRAHGRSIFREGWTGWLGRPVTEVLGGAEPPPCNGHVDVRRELSPGPGAWLIEGWLIDKKSLQSPRHVVVADTRGTVVGLGFTGSPRLDVARAEGRAARNSGFGAFLFADERESGELILYGVDDQIRCRLPAPIRLGS